MWTVLGDSNIMNGSIQDQLENMVDEALEKCSFIEFDGRFQRQTQTSHCAVLTITNLTVLTYLRAPRQLMEKYRGDASAMQPSFMNAVKEQERHKNSRQIVIYNTFLPITRKPCFLSVQFLWTRQASSGQNIYTMCIYQRSGDRQKFHDDCIYFGYVMREFEKATKSCVNKITIFYGSLHKTYENHTGQSA